MSTSYGDKAFKVARLAQLTGKRWPVVGRKLHDDYPYIEAEARSALAYFIFIILCPIIVPKRLKICSKPSAILSNSSIIIGRIQGRSSPQPVGTIVAATMASWLLD